MISSMKVNLVFLVIFSTFLTFFLQDFFPSIVEIFQQGIDMLRCLRDSSFTILGVLLVKLF